MSKRKKHALAWALFWTAMTLAVPGTVVAAAMEQRMTNEILTKVKT